MSNTAHDLAQRLGAPLSLAGIGMREADIEQAVAQAAARPYPNPRPIEAAALRRLLQNAYTGQRPAGEHA